ncbi:hypothetical protein FACS1894108_06790 [Planctomycetales bacterium]|nr:hypothetical protein FACS1894108_06790 [Planctomycetales bacterium]
MNKKRNYGLSSSMDSYAKFLDDYKANKTMDETQSKTDEEKSDVGVNGSPVSEIKHPLNQILYGPPGTGKTYNSVVYAVAAIDGKDVTELANNYQATKTRYDELKKAGQIASVTFHQSYGYEEFIEGIKPVVDDADSDDAETVKYEVASGAFKKFCATAAANSVPIGDADDAISPNAKIWKVSLERTGDNATRTDCLEHNRIRIGWDEYKEDLTGETQFSAGGERVLNAFIAKMKKGDVVVSCYSASMTDAIGVIEGDYEWDENLPQYKRVRKVRWLRKNLRYDITSANRGTGLTLATVYELKKISLAEIGKILRETATTTVGAAEKQNAKTNRYVFIIDEINRGNISKIFGELITLIEEDKREGAKNALEVTLPYSGDKFSVPKNVHIIGTMNTADRSIALLDTALRRRFEFVEMMPKPELLAGVEVDGCDMQKMLTAINQRIEILYDREHTIGHAYFLPLKETPTMDKLCAIFRHKILPLLQEYFYEDWGKIRLVFGDNQARDEALQFVKEEKIDAAKYKEVFGSDADNKFDEFDGENTRTYKINEDAFSKIKSYIKIYDAAGNA